MTVFPWLAQQWQLLQKREANGQLPHAFIFSGIIGVGKHQFAQQFVQSLLCEQPGENKEACGICRSCHLFQSSTHPDLNIIEPEDGKVIKIEQIRLINDIIYQTAQLASYKVVFVSQAERMNENAANAFLKILEEPLGQTIFILLTDRQMSLLPTIRSRCQTMIFSAPAQKDALSWLLERKEPKALSQETLLLLLTLTHNAPLEVLRWIEQDELSFRQKIVEQWIEFHDGRLDFISLADQWSKLDIRRVLFHLENFIQDMIRIYFNVAFCNQDLGDFLKRMTQTVTIQKMFEFWDIVKQSQQLIEGPNHPNPTLLIEHVLLAWRSS